MKTQDRQEELFELAGEYVLGALEDRERERFERQLAKDYHLQDEVAAWRRRLGPMLETVEPVTPPAGVWRRIECRIAPRVRQRKTGLWNSLNFWRGVSLATIGLVLGLGLNLFGLLQGSGELQQLMVVTNNQSRVGWIVDTRERDPMLHVRAVEPTPLPGGKVCQLWLETPDGELIPVGILPHDGSRKMRIPAADAGRFKVSIESADEAPVERPSAEIVFEGSLTSI
jgi:anti-sigma-K factor RskA